MHKQYVVYGVIHTHATATTSQKVANRFLAARTQTRSHPSSHRCARQLSCPIRSMASETWHPHQGKTVNFVDAPHPNWKPGEKLPHSFGSDKYIELKPEELGNDLYPTLTSAVCPRPVGFVCCLNSKGQRNLSPYSYFNVMNHDPALVVLGANRSAVRGGGMKDMEQYVRETGEFTINLISDWFVEASNFTSGTFDAGVDEVDMCGLTPIPSIRVKPPRLKESVVHFECKLKHIYDTTNAKGVTTGAIIIAEIVLVHIHEGVAAKSPHGKTIVDIDKYEPSCRIGGNMWCKVKEVFELIRPNDEQMQERQEEFHKQTNKHPEHVTDETASHKQEAK